MAFNRNIYIVILDNRSIVVVHSTYTRCVSILIKRHVLTFKRDSVAVTVDIVVVVIIIVCHPLAYSISNKNFLLPTSKEYFV